MDGVSTEAVLSLANSYCLLMAKLKRLLIEQRTKQLIKEEEFIKRRTRMFRLNDALLERLLGVLLPRSNSLQLKDLVGLFRFIGQNYIRHRRFMTLYVELAGLLRVLAERDRPQDLQRLTAEVLELLMRTNPPQWAVKWTNQSCSRRAGAAATQR